MEKIKRIIFCSLGETVVFPEPIEIELGDDIEKNHIYIIKVLVEKWKECLEREKNKNE